MTTADVRNFYLSILKENEKIVFRNEFIKLSGFTYPTFYGYLKDGIKHPEKIIQKMPSDLIYTLAEKFQPHLCLLFLSDTGVSVLANE